MIFLKIPQFCKIITSSIDSGALSKSPIIERLGLKKTETEMITNFLSKIKPFV